MADKRSFNAGQWALTLDGVNIGFCTSVTGGLIEAKVASHKAGASIFERKHQAGIDYSPITIKVATSMGKGLWDWIDASLTQSHVTRSGEVISCNYDGEEMRVLEFYDAHITSVKFPELDGSKRDAAYIEVTFDPERLRHRKGSGSKVQGQFGSKHKKWLVNNWRFNMGGWDCAKVSKIGAIEAKISTVKDEVGCFIDATKHPGAVTFTDLEFYASMATAEQFEKEFQKTVIEGVNGVETEMQGSIEFLSPDLKTTLGTVELINVGMLSLEHEALEANQEKVARIKVKCFFEELKTAMQVFDT